MSILLTWSYEGRCQDSWSVLYMSISQTSQAEHWPVHASTYAKSPVAGCEYGLCVRFALHLQEA